MIATALYTGLRISELLGLTWDDIDFGDGVLHVRAQLSRAHRGREIRARMAASPFAKLLEPGTAVAAGTVLGREAAADDPFAD